MKPAQDAFVSGDPEPFKALWSQKEEATIFGGFGGRAEGWAELDQRLDWAASQFASHFSDVSWRWQLIRETVGPEPAFSVHLETTEPDDPAKGQGRQELRVTQLYRYVDDDWRIVHRHAGTLVVPSPASAT